MRIFVGICVAALLVAFAVPAFAETQNIKVSGDIKVAYIYQSDIDFRDNDSDNQNFFMDQIGLNVEADLTDNVSTYIRLINERDWNAEDSSANQFDILLDEAYITMKEMLYAPLTVKVGRQNVWLGRGFVMGNSGVNVWSKGGLPTTVQEMSEMTAFDAVRATLDYDPWTIDLIYSKIDADNNTVDTNNHDDTDLYVANVGYDFTKYDAEAEVYYIFKHDRVATAAGTGPKSTDEVHTIGLRGSLVPFENMNLWAEGALQYGEYRNEPAAGKNREAAALDLGVDYTFVDVKWTPKLGVEAMYLSGNKADATGDGDWKAWDPLYRGMFNNYLLDFRNITKATWSDAAAQRNVGTNQNNNGMTNLSSLAIFGSMEPMTDITLDARLTFEKFNEAPVAGYKKNIGTELDGKITYDYTEDVEFTLAGGVVWPGDYYKKDDDSSNKTAGQIVAATTVDF
jgi:hypothetical protein